MYISINERRFDMNTPIQDKILLKIRTNKQGWAFSATDFIKDYKRGDIDVALSNLAETGAIRRVMRGIYDYPMFSTILNKITAPDINQVAKAIARKFNWNIFPDGDTALNYLGLSNQMVAKYIYLSDGASKNYTIGDILLEFKHISKKDAIIKDEKSAIVIQAIRAMGDKQITPDFINKLSGKFTNAEWNKIAENAKSATGWIYDIIKQAKNIAEGTKNG